MLMKQIAFLSILCGLLAGSLNAQAAMPMPESNLFSLKEVAQTQLIAAGEEHTAPAEKAAEHKCAGEKAGEHKCGTDKKGEHKCASKKCGSEHKCAGKKGEHKCASKKCGSEHKSTSKKAE